MSSIERTVKIETLHVMPIVVTAALTFLGTLAMAPAASAQLANHKQYASGLTADKISALDLTGDGVLDLVASIAGSGSSAFTILPGTGVGSFSPPVTVNLSTAYRTLRFADLDNDGKPDVATGDNASTFSNTVSVRLGNGTGSFGPASIFATPVTYAEDLYTGDLNNDGRLDVVTCGNATSVSLLLQNGFGFATTTTTFSGVSAFGIQVVDLTGDGFQDIVLHQVNGNGVGYVTGNGNGTFGPHTVLFPGSLAAGFAAGDVNFDGWIDVVTTEFGGSKAHVRRGTAPSAFADPDNYGITGHASAIRILDVDQNSLPDVVLTTGLGVYVLPGTGTGTFEAAKSFSAGTCPTSLTSGDFNGDGLTDAAVSDKCNSKASVLLALGPPAIVYYGTGTAGCDGAQILNVKDYPSIGSPFPISVNRCPPNSTGLWMIGDAPDFAGSDPFNLGVKLHINFFLTTSLTSFNTNSDVLGNTTTTTAVPNTAALIGQTFYVQSLWTWPLAKCFNFPYGLSSSQALAVKIQP